ncbi:MAG: cyclase family protein [Bacteroidota bacterium]
MIARISIGGRDYSTDLSKGRSIAIPLRFSGTQPNSYDVPPAIAVPFEAGAFIGDTRRGGSCNFDTVTLTPHCNGTHTECVGHISNERISVEDILKPSLLPATLISVQIEHAMQSEEHYEPAKAEGDLLITASALRNGFEKVDPSFSTETAAGAAADFEHPGTGTGHPVSGIDAGFYEAIIIRTLPNDSSKLSRRYMEEPAAFFSIEAMRFLRGLGVRHLLVDIPSLDRAFDEGRMVAHHIFWDAAMGSHEILPGDASPCTVTEMIFVEDDIPDGRYLIDIQIAPFVADAAPSRPVIFPLTPNSVGT